MGALHELEERYADAVSFVVVYIREAHPEEGWVVTPNRDEDIRVNDPTDTDERVEVRTFFKALDFWKAIIDNLAGRPIT